MIFIVVRFRTKPEWTQRWPELVKDFTEASRAEPGNLWFRWSRSLEDPAEYVLVEAFQDDAAEAHVTSEHFTTAMAQLGQALVERPKVVSRQVEGDSWDELGEVQM